MACTKIGRLIINELQNILINVLRLLKQYIPLLSLSVKHKQKRHENNYLF
jgi:hypothetical protein